MADFFWVRFKSDRFPSNYEYLVMSYGLVHAPSVFQTFTTNVLSCDMLGKCMVAYIDNILIYSNSLIQLNQHIRVWIDLSRTISLWPPYYQESLKRAKGANLAMLSGMGEWHTLSLLSSITQANCGCLWANLSGRGQIALSFMCVCVLRCPVAWAAVNKIQFTGYMCLIGMLVLVAIIL